MSQATAVRGPAVGFDPKPWGIPAILLGLIVPGILFAANVGAAIAGQTTTDLSVGEVIANVIASIIVLDGAFVAAPVIVALWRYRLSWSSLGFRPFYRRFWWVPLAGVVAARLVVAVYALVLYAFGIEPSQDVEELFSDRAVLPLVGFSTLIVAPFAEELFFRGFVFAGLIRPLGLYPAILISALLFGAMHVNDASSAWLVPVLAGIGVILATIYWRTGSLWPGIATHFLFNLISFIALAAGVEGG